jgi:predicted TIM-barrel fold metal-dependent hydrolase
MRKGSPEAPYADLVALAQEVFAFLSPAERDQVFRETAQRLYPALAAARTV